MRRARTGSAAGDRDGIKAAAKTPSSDPDRVYREVVADPEVAAEQSEEGLHTLIAEGGLGILDKEVPYLICASRERAWRDRRRDVRRSRLLQRSPGRATLSQSNAAASLWDPYERLAGRERMRILLDLLSDLPNEDVLSLWWHASGVTDREILERLMRLDDAHGALTLDALRQRRSRTRAALKERFAAAVRPPRSG